MNAIQSLQTAEHVLSELQIDALFLLQEGLMVGEESRRWMRTVEEVQDEVQEFIKAATTNPSGFKRFAYAIPGSSQ
jgi:hypothetical protein